MTEMMTEMMTSMASRISSARSVCAKAIQLPPREPPQVISVSWFNHRGREELFSLDLIYKNILIRRVYRNSDDG